MVKARSSALPTSSALTQTILARPNQSLPRNLMPLRSGQRLGGQQALLSYLDKRSNLQKAQDNRDFYNKAMPPKEIPRPQSAMAQLFTENSPLSPKQDSFTAKVRPILSKSNASPNSIDIPTQTSVPSTSSYYSINTNDQPPLSAPPRTASGSSINLFAYKQPPPMQPKSNAKIANIPVVSVQDSKYNHPPPPYPSMTATDSSSGSLSPKSNIESRDSFNERSFTVDIEALRRKFAHAPRPLKKRSSFSEPEHPQGPVIPKSIYDQLYKKADTPFYRPTVSEPEPRSTPPPAYADNERQSSANVIAVENKTIVNKVEDSVSYERNVTPIQFMKQQNLAQGKFKANKPTATLSPPPFEDQSNQLSPKTSSPNLPSTPVSPIPPMPSLNARPSKGILR